MVKRRVFSVPEYPDLDELTLREFKQYMVKELSLPYAKRNSYLVTDPLTEKYIFWCRGQYRLVSVQVVENMLRKGKLSYYSDKAFNIKKMIVGKNFKHLIIDRERANKKQVKKRRWLR